VFAIDELPAAAAIERPASDTAAPAVERRLTTGARYRAVKVFYDPPVLKARLARLGWDVSIRTVGWRFFYASGSTADGYP